MLEKKAAELDRAFLDYCKRPMNLPEVAQTFEAQQRLNHTLREHLAKISTKIQADHDYLEFKKKKTFQK